MGGAGIVCPSCRKRSGFPKQLPYGAKRTRSWCDNCDAAYVPPLPNKKRERQRAKKQIKKDKDS